MNSKRIVSDAAMRKRNMKFMKQYLSAFPSDINLTGVRSELFESETSLADLDNSIMLQDDEIDIAANFNDDENQYMGGFSMAEDNGLSNHELMEVKFNSNDDDNNVCDIDSDPCDYDDDIRDNNAYDDDSDPCDYDNDICDHDCDNDHNNTSNNNSDNDDCDNNENNDNYNPEEYDNEIDDDGERLSVADRDNTYENFNIDRWSLLNIPLVLDETYTAKDYLLSILAIASKSHMSYETVLDLLKLPENSNRANYLPTSKNALWKALGRDDSNITRYYYCKVCDTDLGQKLDNNLLKKQCRCTACGPQQSERNLGCFIHLNLIPQLKQILTTPGMHKKLQYRHNRNKKQEHSIEDIYDGLEYTKLCSAGNFLNNNNNYTLTFNTDGCQLTSSSNVSAWPVFVQINELPPHLRKKHILLAGIYVDEKHPVHNNFLRPFVNKIQNLYNNGITWKSCDNVEITSKFTVIITSVDAPARASVLRMKQFNGRHGCICCYAEGSFLRPGKYIFPVSHSFKKLRNNTEIKRDMIKAFKTKTIINGFKGISSLSKLPKFDMSKGVVIEPMHAIFLGVIKQHTRLFVESKDASYYIGKPSVLKEIDKVLLAIKPPSRRSRMPRSITMWKQWKASEWRNWLSYAPVCLEQIIDSKYIIHLSFLTEAIYYLNNRSISQSQLGRAKSLLETYVRKFEIYFGIENMSYNIHLLTHISETVENWGPMWAYGAFPFESLNRKILDKITSPQNRADQVVTRYFIDQFLAASMNNPSTSNNAKKYMNNIMKNTNYNKGIALANSVKRDLTDIELSILTKGQANQLSQIMCYRNIYINGIEYRVKGEENTKFCNSIICDKNENFGYIYNIVEYYDHEERKIAIFIKHLELTGYAFDTQCIYTCVESENITCVKDIEHMMPAIKISQNTSNKIYVFSISNCWETD